MAKKRQTVVAKWSDPFFMKLTPQAKLIWMYICDNCDHVGIYELNELLMRTQIGFTDKVDIMKHFAEMDKVCKELEIERRVDWFSGSKKLWIVNFIGVQYGVLSDRSSMHVTVLRELGRYLDDDRCGILFSSYLQSVSELISRVHVGYLYPIKKKRKNNKIEGGVGETDFVVPKTETVVEVMFGRCARDVDVEFEANRFIDFYESKGWKVGDQQMVNWQASARSWIEKRVAKGEAKKKEAVVKSMEQDITEKLKKYL